MVEVVYSVNKKRHSVENGYPGRQLTNQVTYTYPYRTVPCRALTHTKCVGNALIRNITRNLTLVGRTDS